MDWQTTSTLLCALHDADNRAAWSRLVGRFQRPIVRLARAAGVPENDADDVAQQTMIAFADAYRRGRYDRAKGRLAAWLFGIAHNHILKWREREARRAGRGAVIRDTDFWSGIADPRAALESEWESALWAECIASVRPEFEPATLRAFELVVRDGKTAAEAAQALGTSIKSVYNAKHRVLKRLREEWAAIDSGM